MALLFWDAGTDWEAMETHLHWQNNVSENRKWEAMDAARNVLMGLLPSATL